MRFMVGWSRSVAPTFVYQAMAGSLGVDMKRSRREAEAEVARMLGNIDPRHPIVIETVEILLGERTRDGSWIKPGVKTVVDQVAEAITDCKTKIRRNEGVEPTDRELAIAAVEAVALAFLQNAKEAELKS